MRRLSWALAPLLCAAGKPALPRKDVTRVVRAAVPDARAVTDVFADLGDGRFPILFTTGGKDCISRMVDGQKDESCSPVTRPHVGIVRRAADGTLALEGRLALPTEAAPWDAQEAMKWGIHFIKDYDGDGKPELMLAYGYRGPSYWAVGDTWYKHRCIVNLDGLSLAVDVLLDKIPQASVESRVESKWTFRPAAAGAAPDIEIQRNLSDGDKTTASTDVYVYDAATDRWSARK